MGDQPTSICRCLLSHMDNYSAPRIYHHKKKGWYTAHPATSLILPLCESKIDRAKIHVILGLGSFKQDGDGKESNNTWVALYLLPISLHSFPIDFSFLIYILSSLSSFLDFIAWICIAFIHPLFYPVSLWVCVYLFSSPILLFRMRLLVVNVFSVCHCCCSSCNSHRWEQLIWKNWWEHPCLSQSHCCFL